MTVGVVDEQRGMGGRVRQAAGETRPAWSVETLAEAAHMDPTALTRAMAGERALSSIEVAWLAEALRVDPYWIITGKPDPLQIRVIACHIRHPREPDYVE